MIADDQTFFDEAIRNNNKNLIGKIFKVDSNRICKQLINNATLLCIEQNKSELALEFIKFGANEFDNFFISACRMNNDVVTTHLYKEYRDKITVNFGFKVACFEGCDNVVAFLMQQVECNLNEGLYEACRGANKNIIECLFGKIHEPDLNYALKGACSCNDVNASQEIIKMLLQKGANDYNAGLVGASKYGNDYATNLMIQLGATNLTDALLMAKYCNQTEIIKLLHKHKEFNDKMTDKYKQTYLK